MSNRTHGLLEKVREHFGVSYAEIARILGVDPRTLYRWRTMGHLPKMVENHLSLLVERIEADAPKEVPAIHIFVERYRTAGRFTISDTARLAEEGCVSVLFCSGPITVSFAAPTLLRMVEKISVGDKIEAIIETEMSVSENGEVFSSEHLFVEISGIFAGKSLHIEN